MREKALNGSSIESKAVGMLQSIILLSVANTLEHLVLPNEIFLGSLIALEGPVLGCQVVLSYFGLQLLVLYLLKPLFKVLINLVHSVVIVIHDFLCL